MVEINVLRTINSSLLALLKFHCIVQNPRIDWSGENGNKTLIEYGLSNQFSDIGKGEVRTIVNSVTTSRRMLNVIGIYPSYGSSHHAEAEMIGKS